MQKRFILTGALALGLGVVVFSPSYALAYRGNAAEHGPNYTPERHAQMLQVFAKKDYNGWKALTNGQGVARKVTAQNFAQFVRVHELETAGKTQEATALRTSLGLGVRDGSGSGMGQGRNRNR